MKLPKYFARTRILKNTRKGVFLIFPPPNMQKNLARARVNFVRFFIGSIWKGGSSAFETHSFRTFCVSVMCVRRERGGGVHGK